MGCFREVQKSIRDSVHKLLGDQIAALGLGAHYEILENQIRGINGTEFLFSGLSAHTVESIKSYEGLDRAWVEEAQTVRKKSWQILRPTIRKTASEIWVSMNPELEDDYSYQDFVAHPPEGSFVVEMNWRDNPWFPEVLEQERLECKERDPDSYDNIWEGVPRRTVEGAIFANEIDKVYADKRIRPVPYDPLLKVHTVWDLGWNDSMSIIFAQRQGGEVRVIDFIEDSHKTLADYVGLIEKKPYRWGDDWIPHDGNAKNIQTGKSAKEMLQAMNRRPRIVEDIGVEPGIKAARMMFPRVYFDEAKTGVLVNHLKRYKRQINQTTEEPNQPLHDEHSHAADAFRYLGVIVDRLTNDDRSKKIVYDNRGIV